MTEKLHVIPHSFEFKSFCGVENPKQHILLQFLIEELDSIDISVEPYCNMCVPCINESVKIADTVPVKRTRAQRGETGD